MLLQVLALLFSHFLYSCTTPTALPVQTHRLRTTNTTIRRNSNLNNNMTRPPVSLSPSVSSLKVLQLNVWLDGTRVRHGVNKLASVIAMSDADIVALSEVKNLKGDFVQQLCAALQHNHNLKFYGSFAGNPLKFSFDADSAIISKFPIRKERQSIVYRTVENSIVKSIIDIDIDDDDDDGDDRVMAEGDGKKETDRGSSCTTAFRSSSSTNENANEDDYKRQTTESFPLLGSSPSKPQELEEEKKLSRLQRNRKRTRRPLRLAVYSVHLEYKCYTTYLPRGYHSQSRRYPGWYKMSGSGTADSKVRDDNSVIVATSTTTSSSTSSSGSDWYSWIPSWMCCGEYHRRRPPQPVIDVDLIHEDNIASGRTYAIEQIIDDVNKNHGDESNDDIDTVLVLGDFNEPSCLDWTDATKEMASHNGLVYDWDTTSTLQNNGFIDSYREVHPSPVTHPGYTWPAAAATMLKLGRSSVGSLKPTNWLQESDERDRIDFIFYRNIVHAKTPANDDDDNDSSEQARTHLHPVSAKLVGTPYMSVLNDIVDERKYHDDEYVDLSTLSSPPEEWWPSDHRGVLIEFRRKQ